TAQTGRGMRTGGTGGRGVVRSVGGLLPGHLGVQCKETVLGKYELSKFRKRLRIAPAGGTGHRFRAQRTLGTVVVACQFLRHAIDALRLDEFEVGQGRLDTSPLVRQYLEGYQKLSSRI